MGAGEVRLLVSVASKVLDPSRQELDREGRVEKLNRVPSPRERE